MSDACDRVGHKVALQGNLDPSVLLTSPEVIATETRRVLDSYGPSPGHIFNLGHGITPQVPPEHVTVLVKPFAITALSCTNAVNPDFYGAVFPCAFAPAQSGVPDAPRCRAE